MQYFLYIIGMEEWRDIKGYEGLYQISNYGRVKSLGRNTTKGKIRKLQVSGNGYLSVTLSKNGVVKRYAVHRLVAESFIPNPHNLPQINHRNEVTTDNFVENLEWCDATYNNNYGKHRSSISKARRKWVIQKDLNNNIVGIYDSPITAAKMTDTCYSSIVGVCNGRHHTAGNYIWKYEKDAV